MLVLIVLNFVLAFFNLGIYLNDRRSGEENPWSLFAFGFCLAVAIAIGVDTYL